VFTQNVPDYEFKDKTSVSSAELLAYMKAIVKENTIFTFGNEKQRVSKMISKLHRVLKTQLTSYASKCVPDLKDIPEISDPA
jgi:uncharacterized membrane protein affecting hemolysin expression